MEYCNIASAPRFTLFDVTADAGKHLAEKPRSATDTEILAYADWLAARAGLPPMRQRVICRASIGRTRHDWRAMGVTYGDIQGGYSIPFPGRNSDRDTVTMETLDESGAVIASQTLPREPKKLGIVWDKAAVAKAVGPIAKPARVRKVKAAAPIAEPAMPAVRPERFRSVWRVIGGMEYGRSEEHGFIVGRGSSFESCDGDRDRWYWQREGRVAAYGPGHETREAAIADCDIWLATQSEFRAEASPIGAKEREGAIGAMDQAERPRVKMRLVAVPAIDAPLPGECAQQEAVDASPVPIAGPKRSPAHVKAIMRYLAMRAERTEFLALWLKHRDARNDADDRTRAMRIKRRRAVMLARSLQNRLSKEYRLVDRANERRQAAERELAELKAARTVNEVRDADIARLLGQRSTLSAQLETARSTIATMEGRSDTLSDELMTMTGRALRAETALAATTARINGWPPAVTRVSFQRAA